MAAIGSNRSDAPLLVIVGETASGKSGLAMKIASQFNCEIIAADSTTAYTGFDIGTAKPSVEERQAIPHHMLDLITPPDKFTAADFQRRANKAIQDISNRQHLSIMVGGSGLYINSVLYDYEFLPEPDPQLRKQLDTMSLEALVVLAQQAGLDLHDIDSHNKRRVIRLIESEGRRSMRKELRPNTLVLGVQLPPAELKRRIVERVDRMLAGGLVEEVKRLANMYGWECEPMRSVGYREFKEYFTGSQSIEQVRERIITDTFRLAKKQRTWFRRNKSIQWVSEQDKAVEHVTTFLNK